MLSCSSNPGHFLNTSALFSVSTGISTDCWRHRARWRATLDSVRLGAIHLCCGCCSFLRVEIAILLRLSLCLSRRLNFSSFEDIVGKIVALIVLVTKSAPSEEEKTNFRVCTIRMEFKSGLYCGHSVHCLLNSCTGKDMSNDFESAKVLARTNHCVQSIVYIPGASSMPI